MGVFPIVANRCAVRIEPQIEFIDWINSQNVNKRERIESVIYLFDDSDLENKYGDWFDNHYPLLFKYILFYYCENEETWPSINDKELFSTWFKVQFSDLIIDLGNEPFLIV